MLLKLKYKNKPPPNARVDLTHPLGRNCQAVCLFNDSIGTMHNPGGISNTFIDTPAVQYYQTQGNRIPLTFGTTAPTWVTNTHGKALYCGSTFSGMDIGFIDGMFSYDLDFPEFLVGATVTRGQTVLVIRRKVDTTARASSLFGVEDSGGAIPVTARCGAHVPYSDGTVYWDYGNNTGDNRLSAAGLTFTTNVEKWIFTAGPRGSTIWRDGIKVASQSVPLTRIVTDQFSNFGGPVINGGNGLSTSGGGDLKEFNFIMYIASQWSDDLCQWWFGEPYAAFYEPFMNRSYFIQGIPSAPISPTEHAGTFFM